VILGLVAIAALLTGRRRSAAAEARPGTAVVLRAPVRRVGEIVSAFESETVAVFHRTAPRQEHIVLYVLVLMLAGMVTLASTVKLDRVVTGVGRVTPVGGQLYISPLDRSIVREVLVRAGDVVSKGQTLATLDPTFANADLAQLTQRLASHSAEVARRQAELAGRPYAPAEKDQYAMLQQGIYNQRQAEYRATLEEFDARISGAQSAIAQHRRDIQDYEKRLALARQSEKMYADLRKRGYVTEQQLIAATDTRVEVGRLLAASESQMATTTHNLGSLRAQRDAFVQKWRADTSAGLVAAQNELDATREMMRKAEKLNELSSLTAPADAIVLNVGRISTGSVASAGGDQSEEPLFTLVPLTSNLEAEIRISTNDIGFIQVGDTVRLKLDAYSFVRHGTATGIVKNISEGAFTHDEMTDTRVAPYFKAVVNITETDLRNVPENFRLIPGMTLHADILVGSRTILSYLVEGALRTGSQAMREPN
jgi:hemolysin D